MMSVRVNATGRTVALRNRSAKYLSCHYAIIVRLLVNLRKKQSFLKNVYIPKQNENKIIIKKYLQHSLQQIVIKPKGTS